MLDPAHPDADHVLHWPAAFSARWSDAWARSQLAIKAEPADVFSRLNTLGHWERDFSGIRNVRFPASGPGCLEPDSEFEFEVDGVRLEARVVESAGVELGGGRLAWSGQGTDISVYHAWVVFVGPGRSVVLTGFAARGAAAVALTEPDPGRTQGMLDRWARDLRQAAEGSHDVRGRPWRRGHRGHRGGRPAS
jgi:hypothetical protein